MKCSSWAFQALSTSSLLFSSVSASNSNVFESLHALPRGWTRSRCAQPDESVILRLSLKQQNLDQFYDNLMQVSTPDHPQYGKHYEGHELRSLLSPSQEASSTAISWLQDNNVTSIRDDGEYVLFRTTVATANKLLDTEFQWYKNEGGEELLRTTKYSVPREVGAHINFVQPTTRFGSTKRFGSRMNPMAPGQATDGQSKWVPAPQGLNVNAASTTVNASCATSITPQCLFQLYNINMAGTSAGGNKIGYASFVGESARFTDMTAFSKVYAPFMADSNVSVMIFLSPKCARRSEALLRETGMIYARNDLTLTVCTVLSRDAQRRSQRPDEQARFRRGESRPAVRRGCGTTSPRYRIYHGGSWSACP